MLLFSLLLIFTCLLFFFIFTFIFFHFSPVFFLYTLSLVSICLRCCSVDYQYHCYCRSLLLLLMIIYVHTYVQQIWVGKFFFWWFRIMQTRNFLLYSFVERSIPVTEFNSWILLLYLFQINNNLYGYLYGEAKIFFFHVCSVDVVSDTAVTHYRYQKWIKPVTEDNLRNWKDKGED